MTKRQLITWLEECGAPDDAVVLVPMDDRGDGDLQEYGVEAKLEMVPVVHWAPDKRYSWTDAEEKRLAVVIR